MPETLRLEQLEEPSRSEKLHPYEGEEENFPDASLEELQEYANDDDSSLASFDRFRLSVGLEPDYPLIVSSTGDGEYRIVDGDRRAHALKKNGAEEVTCVVKHMDDVERVATMIRNNEEREDSDPKKRAWNIAQFVAPWLLPPGERQHGDEQSFTQTEFAEKAKTTQANISRWLKFIRRDNELRNVFARSVPQAPQVPTADDVDTIDEIIYYLCDSDNPVITKSERLELVQTIGDTQGVSLSEMYSLAEMAVEKDWDFQQFKDELSELDMSDKAEEESDVEAGKLGGDDDESMTADEIADDVGVGSGQSSGPGDMDDDADDFFADEIEDDSGDSDVDDAPQNPFGEIEMDVDWENYVSDDDLPEGQTVEMVQERPITTVELHDEGSVAIQILAAKYDMTPKKVAELFVTPEITKATINFLKDESDDVEEVAA